MKGAFSMDYELMMNGNVKIGQIAPEFCATTTMGNISLNDYKGKWIVLFSHPGDFTPVWAYNLGKIAYTLKTSFLGY
jgi:probable peroxiredoxin 2